MPASSDKTLSISRGSRATSSGWRLGFDENKGTGGLLDTSESFHKSQLLIYGARTILPCVVWTYLLPIYWWGLRLLYRPLPRDEGRRFSFYRGRSICPQLVGVGLRSWLYSRTTTSETLYSRVGMRLWEWSQGHRIRQWNQNYFSELLEIEPERAPPRKLHMHQDPRLPIQWLGIAWRNDWWHLNRVHVTPLQNCVGKLKGAFLALLVGSAQEVNGSPMSATAHLQMRGHSG